MELAAGGREIWLRSESPTSAKPLWSGTRKVEAFTRDCLAGHACCFRVAEFRCAWGTGPYRTRTGLPLATYFSGLKIRWILEEVAGTRAKAEAGDLLFAISNLSDLAPHRGRMRRPRDRRDQCRPHPTDDLNTLQWNRDILNDFASDPDAAENVSSSESTAGAPAAIDIRSPAISAISKRSGRQACFKPGERRIPTVTGCFMLMTLEKRQCLELRLLTTLAYKFGTKPACYALEGASQLRRLGGNGSVTTSAH